jgi:hypothetical protein
MSRADRVDLIQTKLEVEADAQKILLKEGGPNVDRAMAQAHLINIEEKLGELDKATQAGRVPEWVEHADAPRLFSKEGEEASETIGTKLDEPAQLGAPVSSIGANKIYSKLVTPSEAKVLLADSKGLHIDIFGGEASQFKKAVNVDIEANVGVRADITEGLGFIPSNSAKNITTLNPFIGDRKKKFVSDILADAKRILEPGGKITIAASKGNPYVKIK